MSLTAESRAASARAHWPAISPEDRETLRATLWWDVSSEYDARFLTDYLRQLDVPFTDDFRAAADQWDVDEAEHCSGFREIYEALFGSCQSELDARKPDFAGVAHLFRDEFSISCLMAYDELATVRGYRVNMHLYDQLGPEVSGFVRHVIADEGRHYGAFAKVMRKHYAHRLDEVPAIVAEVRRTEGTPYAQTFVLDHDEDIYTDKLFDEAQELLLKHMSSHRARVAP